MGANMTLTGVTFECDSYTQSLILTGTNVILTRMSVILTRTRLFSTRRVRFPHAECDFTRNVWFPQTRE
jgi:hypothetical protein